MIWEIGLGVLLAVCAVVFLPMAAWLLWTVLECITLAAIGYGAALYAGQFAAKPISSGTWWLDLILAAIAGWVLFGILWFPVNELHHRYQHGTWEMFGREWWDSCDTCDEDRLVDTQLMDLLRKRLEGIPVWSRTLNDAVATIKSLPLGLLHHVVPLALLAWGFAEPSMLPWGLAAGFAYLLLKTWAVVHTPFRVRTRLCQQFMVSRDSLLESREPSVDFD
jgi:hypothetical protein